MGRAERRKAEREERKWQVKNDPTLLRLEAADRKRMEAYDRLSRNGITPKDLEKAVKEAQDSAYQQGIEAAMKMCYAASCVALHREFGFGKERCIKALTSMDNAVIYSLTSEELIDEVFNKIGIEICFSEGVDRVKEK